MYKSYFNHFKSLLGYSTVNTDLDCNSVYKSHIDDKVNEEFRKRGLIKKEQILVENDKSYRDINITNINNCIKKKIELIRMYLETKDSNKYFIEVMNMLNIKITGNSICTYKEYIKLKEQFNRYMLDIGQLKSIKIEYAKIYDIEQHNLSLFDWSSIYTDYILFEEQIHYSRLLNEDKLIPLTLMKEHYARLIQVDNNKEDEKTNDTAWKKDEDEVEKSIDEWNERNDIEEREYYKNNYEEDDDEYDD
jgi:hypothetical protein